MTLLITANHMYTFTQQHINSTHIHTYTQIHIYLSIYCICACVLKHGGSFNTQVYVPLYLFILRVQTRISAIHLKLLISGGLRGKRKESWTDTQSLGVTEGLWDPCCATTTPIQIHQLSTIRKYDTRTQSSLTQQELRRMILRGEKCNADEELS